MAGEKILLVEDNPVNQRLTEFLLRSHGYQIRRAATAQEAFKIVNSERCLREKGYEPAGWK